MSTLTIIWDYRRDGRQAFDIDFQGKRYQGHRDTASGVRFASGVRQTAERSGFRYVAERRAFVMAFEEVGGEAKRLVSMFERQGFTVRNTGAVPASLFSAEPKAEAVARPRASYRERIEARQSRVIVTAPPLTMAL